MPKNPTGTGKMQTALELFFLYLLVSAAALRAADPWAQVVGNGFGDPNRVQVTEFHVFNGQLYAGISRKPGSGVAELWRTSDGKSWTQVSPAAFSPTPQATLSAAFISMADSGGASPFYLGTNAGVGGTAVIYRSTDGISWTQINQPGSGWVSTGNVFISPNMVVTGGFLYAGTANATGGQIWRRPVDNSVPWAKVLDFANIDRNTNSITYLYVFKNVIYAAAGSTNADNINGSNTIVGSAHLYSSADGVTWTKNAGVGNGFGNINTVVIASIVDFGGFLYCATHNNFSGGELWRSSDTVSWTKIPDSANGFGNSKNTELHSIRVAQGQLWVTTISLSPIPFPVFRSSDGLNFIQSNVSGFGDSNNTSLLPSNFSTSMGFGNFVYWGGANAVTGAQIWRVAGPFSSTGTGGPSINSGGIINGASFTLTSSSLAPGSIAAIFGKNLTDGAVCIPPNCGPAFDTSGKVIPTLAGAEITFNDVPAPILSTPGVTQLNAQIPVELAGSASATVKVTLNGQIASSTVSLAPFSPGLIAANSSGSGQGAILNDKDANVGVQSFVAPLGSAPNAHPAVPGEVIEIYATGLGAVTPAVETGMRPSGLPQTAPVSVTIGGFPAQVLFSGLASCCVGLNQINVVLPAGMSPNDSVPVVLTIGGVQSNTVTIAVSGP